MAIQTLTLVSSDGVEFEMKKEDVQKVLTLKRMLSFNASFAEGTIPLPDVASAPLSAIVRWLRLHEDEEPRTEEHHQTFRFNRNVAKKDVDLLDEQFPRAKLADVINAAYSLDIPDLIDTLVKYTANNLEGRTAEEMSQWLEIPLKRDVERNANDVE
uniref:Skp1-related protein n=1 Tax=Steinernema glaseri TaxID=37863 RepID=A0A1I7YX44_9BILA